MSDSEAVGSLPASLLKGNYVASTLTQSGEMKKFILAETNFKTFNRTTQLPANQCWLECDLVQASELSIAFPAPTHIEGITMLPKSSIPTIYNTAGQRLTTPQRGINIIDHKKVLVK